MEDDALIYGMKHIILQLNKTNNSKDAIDYALMSLIIGLVIAIIYILNKQSIYKYAANKQIFSINDGYNNYDINNINKENENKISKNYNEEKDTNNNYYREYSYNKYS
jgi:hypothetical protein